MAPTDEPSDSGRERWSLTFTDVQLTVPEGSDLYYYERNYLAIVPMRVDEHDWELLEALRGTPPPLPAWRPEGSR